MLHFYKDEAEDVPEYHTVPLDVFLSFPMFLRIYLFCRLLTLHRLILHILRNNMTYIDHNCKIWWGIRTVLDQAVIASIPLQCIFSYAVLANPRVLLLLSIFTFAWEREMAGKHCLSIRHSPVISLVNNVFSHECFDKCSTFNGSVCGCMLILWTSSGKGSICDRL